MQFRPVGPRLKKARKTFTAPLVPPKSFAFYQERIFIMGINENQLLVVKESCLFYTLKQKPMALNQHAALISCNLLC